MPLYFESIFVSLRFYDYRYKPIYVLSQPVKTAIGIKVGNASHYLFMTFHRKTFIGRKTHTCAHERNISYIESLFNQRQNNTIIF